MALKTVTISCSLALFGILAFVLGVLAENFKPAAGVPIGKDVVICKFPKDPTVSLGATSFVALVISTFVGVVSVFYPYQGKHVPRSALFESTSLVVFFVIATGVTLFGGVMTLWATITEGIHHINNVHHAGYECPTAKTGLFGGAAFVSLCSMLFWLICQMLAHNSREDHLNEDPKGDYGEVTAVDYEETPSKVIP